MKETGKLVITGKRDRSRDLYVFLPQRGGNMREWTLKCPCEHSADDLLRLQIAGNEYLTLSCSICQKITLMNVEEKKEEQQVDREAFTGQNVCLMCHGQKNSIFVTLDGSDQALELNCSKIPFEIVKNVNIRSYNPYDICYMPLHNSLVVSDNDISEVNMIPCDKSEVTFKFHESVEGMKPGPILYLPRHDKLLVGDFQNCKIQVFDPKRKSHLQTIEQTDMGSISLLLMFNGQIIMLHKFFSSFEVAYFSLK